MKGDLSRQAVVDLMKKAASYYQHEGGAIDAAEYAIRRSSSLAELRAATACYAAIIGERSLPPGFGKRP